MPMISSVRISGESTIFAASHLFANYRDTVCSTSVSLLFH
jgi:hypothetical protein